MKLSIRQAFVLTLLLSAAFSIQAQTENAAEPTAPEAVTVEQASAEQAPVDKVSQQELTSIQNYQLQAQNIRLQMQVLNRQLADVSTAQQAYVESVFASNKRGPEWTINTQNGAWEKKADLQTADASTATPAPASAPAAPAAE